MTVEIETITRQLDSAREEMGALRELLKIFCAERGITLDVSNLPAGEVFKACELYSRVCRRE